MESAVIEKYRAREYNFRMKMTLLGTGTSHGIPCIACNCAVCRSEDPHDKRLRCCAYVTNENPDGTVSSLLVDIGPEFRIQALRSGIKAVDAVLLTHSHADHLHGLDDIRIFSHTLGSDRLSELVRSNPENAGIDPKLLAQSGKRGISLYANADTVRDVKKRFDYIFRSDTQIGGGKPKLELVDCSVLYGQQPQEFGSMTVIPVPMKHGELNATGWLFSVKAEDGIVHSIAYLTDCSFIPESSLNLIREKGGHIDHCVIDALRVKPHSTHFGFRQAMEVAQKLCARHTWFIHICHLMSHEEIKAYASEQLKDFPVLNKIVSEGGSVGPAYDCLELSV